MIRRFFERRRQGDRKPAHQRHDQLITGKLEHDIDAVRDLLEDSGDLMVRTFFTGGSGRRAAVLYIDSLVDIKTLQDHVLAPVIQYTSLAEGLGTWEPDMGHLVQSLGGTIVTAASVAQSDTVEDLSVLILTGQVGVLIEGQKQALVVDCPSLPGRPVSETSTETTVRGSKESFVENIQTNIALMRRRVRNTGLKVEFITVGRRSKTRVALLYYSDIAQEELVNEVRRRLRTISTDVIDSTGQIEQLIEDNTWSPFPHLLNTERPDRVLDAVTSGRVGILVDGAPFALIAPAVFTDFIISPDDYYERWLVGSVIRVTRFINVIITSTLPAIYIAITSFVPGLLPTTLALAITGARVDSPFPAFLEALIMEATLEILQEAGVRLPKAVGQTVTFVGGLIIGQAAVEAGLVSPIMVIIVSLTAVTSFTIPNYSMNLALRLFRVPLMIAAATLGLYGIVISVLLILIHLCSLKSFGIAYVSPLTPYNLRDWKDAVIRSPTARLSLRPEFLEPKDQDRSQGTQQRRRRGGQGRG